MHHLLDVPHRSIPLPFEPPGGPAEFSVGFVQLGVCCLKLLDEIESIFQVLVSFD